MTEKRNGTPAAETVKEEARKQADAEHAVAKAERETLHAKPAEKADTSSAAYQQGIDAARNAIAKDDAPYGDDDANLKDWLAGYKWAKGE